MSGRTATSTALSPSRGRFSEPGPNGSVSTALHWTPVISPGGRAFYTGDPFPVWQESTLIGGLTDQDDGNVWRVRPLEQAGR